MALSLGELYGTITVDGKPALDQIGKVQKGLQGTGDAADQAQAAVDAASRKVEKALQREADAAGAVRVAQAKMAEAQKNSSKDSAKYIAAQERLETANRKLASAQGEARKSVEEMGKAHEQVGESLDKSEGKLKDFGGKAAGLAAAAGAAIGAALAAGILKTMDIEKANDKLAAQLGLNAKESEQAGKVAGSLYAGAYGESIEEVNVAVGGVMSSISGMRDASEKDLEAMTAKVLDLSTAFEIDATRAAQVAGQMITTGLAKDGNEALDLLVGNLQKVPAAVREDLLDAVDEYGPFFRDLGIQGSDAMGMLARAAEDGMYGIDKTGDALKEFTIRSTDMSKATRTTYDTLGLSTEEMTNKILAGGDQASGALGDIVNGLMMMEDPGERAAAAISLFGTPLEDLSVTEIPNFLGMIDPMGDAFDTMSGKAAEMGDTLKDNAATKIESFRRTLETGVVNFIGDKVIPAFEDIQTKAQPVIQWLMDTAPIWGPFAVGVGAVAAAFAAWAIASWAVAGALAVITSPITLTIAGIGLLIGIVITAYNKIGWFKDGVNTAFGFIKDVIGNVVAWFRDTAVPWFTSALGVLGAAFSWLWTYFIKPAFDLIGWGVNAMWTIVNGIFQVMIAGLKFALGPAFKWFQDYVQPILDTVGRIIGDLWKKHVEPVFKWMGDGVKAIPTAFAIARDGISRAWNAIKQIARGPVEFVINRVINDGLIDTFNKIPGVNIKRIPLPPGFNAPVVEPNRAAGGPIRARAKGGFTSPGWTLVGEEGPELVNFANPGRVYTAKQSANIMHNAANVGRYSLSSTKLGDGQGPLSWGRTQQAFKAAGKAYVDNEAGWGIQAAARMWDRAAGLRILAGNGSPQIRTSSAGNLPGSTLAYAFEDGGIVFNEGWAGRLSQAQRAATAAHEIGHVLGLPHTNSPSLMQPNIGQYLSPTPFDIANLQRLYPGGTGKAGSPSPANPFAGMVGTFVAAIKQAFPGGGMFVDAGVGLAKTGIQSVIDFVSDIKNNIGNIVGGVVDGIRDFFGGGASMMTPTLMDGGGWLHNTGAPQLVDHRRQKPDAFTPFDEWQQMKADYAGRGNQIELNLQYLGERPEQAMDRAQRRLMDTLNAYA